MAGLTVACVGIASYQVVFMVASTAQANQHGSGMGVVEAKVAVCMHFCVGGSASLRRGSSIASIMK